MELSSTRARCGNVRALHALRAALALSTALFLGSCNDPVRPSLGTLIVTITGLPEGWNAIVSVYPTQANSGPPPPNAVRGVQRTDTITGLASGVYTVDAYPLAFTNGIRWNATPASQQVTVSESTRPATVSIAFALGPTQLEVTLPGLPVGMQAAITVTGPGGFSETLTGPDTLSNLEPGTYTVTAAPVTRNGGASWHSPVPTAQEVTLVEGQSLPAPVAYSTFGLGLEPVVTGLTNPVHLSAPTGDQRLFIVEQPGRIRIVKDGQLLAVPFLDISAHVRCCGEEGLLSVAFDPAYGTTGYFWVYFTDVNGNIAIRRHHAAPTADVADADSLPVLNIPHPTYSNHNGGMMMFGPDGMLYIATGDGGGGGDPGGNGQNLNTLLGKMLRIDVRTPPYVIPAGNPFRGQAGRRGEIWAYGLRNPWRFDIDTFLVSFGTEAPLIPVRQLYIADVGQARFEEINVAFAGEAGINYGWNIMEGMECYVGTTCDRTGLHLPTVSYGHALGCSVTGGYAYRGTRMPEIRSEFFYSDYCNGWISSVSGLPPYGMRTRQWITTSVGNVTSFGEDGAGELYVLVAVGNVYRLVRR